MTGCPLISRGCPDTLDTRRCCAPATAHFCISIAYIICYNFLIIWLHVLLAFHLSKNLSGEFWKTYFGILAENFGEMLEILRIFLRYFEIILKNCLEYFHEISWTLQKKCRKSKFSIKFWKIMEKHPGNFKLLILQKLRRVLKMFLSSFSEIVKKFWRKVWNTLYKFLDILKGHLVTFLRQFLEKLVKNYSKNVKLFWENFGIIWRNYKIIILGTFWTFLRKYVRALGEFWKTNFELLTGNFKKMLEIWRKFLMNFGLTLKYFEYFCKIS